MILFLKGAGEFVIHGPGELLIQRHLVVEQTLLAGEQVGPDSVCLWVKVLGRD